MSVAGGGEGIGAADRDDRVLPFQVDALDARGRVVRLGPSIDSMLSRHAYPPPVAKLLGEAAALTVLLGASLKIEGRFQLQTRSDGPVEMLVVDFDAPDKVRAYARFDRDRVVAAAVSGAASDGAFLGRGHLAFTIDPGGDMNRYQGVVALDGGTLEDAAHTYFEQSEQIPTRVRLAVAEALGGAAAHAWRAGGLLVQYLPALGGRPRDIAPGDLPDGHEPPVPPPEDDAWIEARSLVETIEDHELVDPTVSSEELLYRLFHERGVRVFDAQPVREECRCSRERILAMLRDFSPQDRADMVADDGDIVVTCEFCSTTYRIAPGELETV